MKEKILTEDEEEDEDIEDNFAELEEDEEEEEEVQQPQTPPLVKKKRLKAKPVEVKEKYEIFTQQERIGIANTLTREVVVEGFKEEDFAILQTLRLILNQLDKIAIAAGV